MSGERPLRALRHPEPSFIVNRIAMPSFCGAVSLMLRVERQMPPSAAAGATARNVITPANATQEKTLIIGTSVNMPSPTHCRAWGPPAQGLRQAQRSQENGVNCPDCLTYNVS